VGIQDRDYYREWWRNKTGYRERARFRVPAHEEGRATDTQFDGGGEYLVQGPPDPIGANWHWSLKLAFWLGVAVLLLALRRVLK
jgi:hypothetical protein